MIRDYKEGQRNLLGVLLVCLLVVGFSVNVFSQPMEIGEGAMCAECGMKVDKASPFIAQIVTKDGKLLSFCDVGDMLIHYKKMKEKPETVFVKDMTSGTWIDALTAHYVKSSEFSTPMGYGIGAFKDKDSTSKKGALMTFNEAMEMPVRMPMKMH
ncbi:MAG: nitrous oxide reductase accessory protein NosL [Nitrospirae bacterium]|nr:nitrous oxide reductase accessory protein NosL [Nitrospirota bacterium]